MLEQGNVFESSPLTQILHHHPIPQEAGEIINSRGYDIKKMVISHIAVKNYRFSRVMEEEK